MTPHERRLVRFLSRPSAYPHPSGPILQRETHVSHVFLAGPFAYKLKKSVRFPFLDASTLERRRRFCQLELSLNRRLAPRVYLGMVAVRERGGRLRLGGQGPASGRASRVVEWLVKMRRLPEERMLDRLVARRRVSRRQVAEIGDRLVRFFRAAARGRAVARYGTPQAVVELLLGNLRECRPFLGRLLSEGEFGRLEAAYRQALAIQEPRLARRVRHGRVIDGHGDLRCENICLPAPRSARQAGLTHGPVIFDCVEFQPAFRCGDALNDFAFLVMDLEVRGRYDLARALVERYRRGLCDPDLDRLLPVYKCHRALVRAKVRALAWQQHPGTAQGRRLLRLARRHVRQALIYARQFAPPRLLVVGGLIGTGKSTLARGLAEALGAVWVRTDEIRLREFGGLRRRRQGFAEGLYTARVSQLVYERLIRRAEALVRAGHSVVCDGTFSKAAGREALRRIARRHRASFHFFECVVPRAVALKRVAKRYAARTDVSEARPEHYDRLHAGYEPVRGWPRKDWTAVSDNRPPQATFRSTLASLRRTWSGRMLEADPLARL
jgi:aminoglycoside phosphotransferase family enzyme/predicted kinase